MICEWPRSLALISKSIGALIKITINFYGGAMLNTINKLMYTAFGLNVKSEILLPEVIQSIEQRGSVDVEIIIDDVPLIRNEWSYINYYFAMKENEVLFQVPDVAKFFYARWEDDHCYSYIDANEDQIRLYLLGTCMGVILLQKKILPLHGSVIAIDGKAYAVVGDSGAGKSTLASAFLKQGYQLLTDDVIAVRLNKENIPVVIPSYPQQKLWQQSLDQFGVDSNQYRPLFARETKFSVPVESKFYHEILPLAGIFELIKTNDDELEIHSIQGLNRLHTLYYHTYRNFLIEPFGLMEWHFNTTTSMINKMEPYEIRRPCPALRHMIFQN